MGLPITVGEIPAQEAFVPDRAGVRALSIERDRATDRHRVTLRLCDATATAWGPADGPEVASEDLVAELLATPDSAAKLAALQAVQRMAADVLTVAEFLVALRE